MIRVATHEDIPRIIELGRVLHAESSYSTIPYKEDKVEATMLNVIATGVIFVAEHDGEVVGGIAGGIAEHWFSTERTAFDYSFFIHPEFRNGAIAIRLMTAFFEWAKLLGAKTIRMGITTGIHVERTAKLYRAMGFHEVGQLFQKEI